MEEMTLDIKLRHLKEHSQWKCMNKKEVLDEHSKTWKENGLSNLDYQVIHTESLTNQCYKITVDVQLNHHWTDKACGELDTQY